MLLTPEQVASITEWLQAKVPNLRCPSCGHKHLEVNPELAVLLPVEKKTGEAGYSVNTHSRNVPTCVVATCADCGHIRLFSAKKMGLTL
jgi:DNA-directed RNA polymerase subunit RPC12/RpoP